MFQLPPQFSKNGERLDAFLRMLPQRNRYVFEFRHPSWYDDDILDILRRHQAALCLSDHRDAPAPWEITAPFVYLRAHGPGGHYSGSYSRKTLQSWAAALASWRRQKRDVFVYFDNDQKAAAPRDALRLIRLLEK